MVLSLLKRSILSLSYLVSWVRLENNVHFYLNIPTFHVTLNINLKKCELSLPRCIRTWTQCCQTPALTDEKGSDMVYELIFFVARCMFNDDIDLTVREKVIYFRRQSIHVFDPQKFVFSENVLELLVHDTLPHQLPIHKLCCPLSATQSSLITLCGI